MARPTFTRVVRKGKDIFYPFCSAVDGRNYLLHQESSGVWSYADNDGGGHSPTCWDLTDGHPNPAVAREMEQKVREIEDNELVLHKVQPLVADPAYMALGV